MYFLRLNKRDVLVKVMSVVLVIMVFLGLHTNVFGESLVDIYSEIKSSYPNEINTLKRYGANETDLKTFIAALEEELVTDETLTADSIDESVANAVLTLFFTGEHDNVFDAVFNGWELSSGVLIDAFSSGGTAKLLTLLPKSFLEIGRLVKERVIAIPDAPDEPETGSNASGGSSGESLKEDALTVDSTLINSQVQGQGVKISVSITSSQDSIAIKAMDLEKICAAGKSLEILSAQGNIIFFIPSDLLTQFTGQGIKISAQKISASVAEELTKMLNSEVKRVTAIYELKIALFLEGQSGILFKQPVSMKISYGESFLTLKEEENLAVYHYDEEKGLWVYVGGTINKENKTIEWEASHFSKYTILSGGPGITFADITTHWAKKDIEYLATKGIINGVQKETYEPNRKITRAEFVKMLVNILNLDTNEISNKNFTDVVENSWYYKYVAAASNAGLVKGVSETLFAPNSPITRQEMAVLAVNSLKLKNKLILSDQEKGINLDQFKDAPDISHWAKDACLVALENGIIAGREKNLLAPINDTTRAESAVIIRRLIDKLK